MHQFTDTHNHLYLEQFDTDRTQVVEAALACGVNHMLLPNVDGSTIDSMISLHRHFPDVCLPMMGLHPTSVKPGYEKLLQQMKSWFSKMHFYAVGETGIDLYWDKTFYDLQVASFCTQIEWALEYDLPVVIHSRNSTQQIMEALVPYRNLGLKGVMHCFPGDVKQADWFIEFGFHLGIGGVVTYKKSEMAEVAMQVPLEYLLLETDAPYLPPVPHRGKRNEPSYIPVIAEKIALIKGLSVDEVAEVTTKTAKTLFKIP